ncbi:MAG: hypothetical protein H0T89_08845 [Deltaproteobacteria bacterium]|nr:hypothetical protein [Deltaproteobacteria bacterium]MDQ3297451.1 hypothetical protein [Myxococcota bacterium]
MIEDLPGRYHEYLERFAKELGDVAVGAFAKFSGKLIKKLSFEEFTPAYLEYTEMADRYFESIERGDTINDVILRLIREQAASLVLKPPG